MVPNSGRFGTGMANPHEVNDINYESQCYFTQNELIQRIITEVFLIPACS